HDDLAAADVRRARKTRLHEWPSTLRSTGLNTAKTGHQHTAESSARSTATGPREADSISCHRTSASPSTSGTTGPASYAAPPWTSPPPSPARDPPSIT